MGTPHDDHPVIDLEPIIDPVTGKPVYAEQLPTIGCFGPDLTGQSGRELVIHDGSLNAPEIEGGPAASVTLTNDRFAANGFGDEFAEIEKAQDDGDDVRIVNGRFVTGDPAAQESQSVDLTNKRFAAMSATEVAEVRKLMASGSAGRYVNALRPASDMPRYFPTGARGMYLHTKPTKLGDELHVVIEQASSTSLYHANLWTFQMMDGGRLTNVDLNKWVGTPGMSAHDVHLYPGYNGQGAILCLSPDSRGGIRSLSECVVRCAQWAVGMGEVVRGRTFPFRQ